MCIPYMKPRPIFTDRWNSFWHVFLGILSYQFWIIIPMFIIYQLIDFYDKNLWVDILEFFIGLSCSILVVSLVKH
jgi:hypothetical protein